MTSPTTCDRINTLGRYNLETKIRLYEPTKIIKNQGTNNLLLPLVEKS